jgi:HTH-type transcriptional regulator / antitoxin HigA
VVGNRYIPDKVSPPGETLLEAIEERGISQADLADRIRLSRKALHRIVTGEASISSEMAFRLECALGIPEHFWHNRERQYRELLARADQTARLEESGRRTG